MDTGFSKRIKKIERELKAAALRYSSDDRAPVLLAFGKKEIAEKIIEIARAEGIYITEESEDVLELLEKVKTGTEIPLELFDILARILGYLYSLEMKSR